MKKKYLLLITGFLFLLNILAWQEVFDLNVQKKLKVDFFDVGQGDSAFVELPEGHQILIDGGPDSSLLNKIAQVMPFWDKTIDVVILSHPESDHMQGLLNLLKVYKADYILWTGVVKNTPDFNIWIKLLDEQKNKGAKILIANSDQKIKVGNLIINTLYPFDSLDGQKIKNTSNDTCIVVKLIYGKNSFLFTGDIASSNAEKGLVFYSVDLESDVLKVAHHGSKYSTSDQFLSAVTPQFAVISVGSKNTYGHPTPEVLQRLVKSDIKVLRTDVDGDIHFMSDGNNINYQLSKNK